MEEEVKTLVIQLLDIVKLQTNSKYPDVNEALTSLHDYVQDTKTSKSGLEDKLKKLEDLLSRKSQKKKPCTDHILKIRTAMRVKGKETPKGTKSKEEKRKPSSPAASERTTPLPSNTKQTKTLSVRASPAPGVTVSHLQGQKINVQPSSNRASAFPGQRGSQLQGQMIYVQPSRDELAQTDETTELSGTIAENEEEYQDEMVDEVRFFMECLNGLKKVFSDDAKIPLEKIIPVPKGKIKKKVKTGHRLIMDVAGDISQLKTENQYLRKTLDGLHKYIIGGDERALNELKALKHIKDNQSVVEVEVIVKEVTQKFHETKTDISRLKTENQHLRKTFDGLHKYILGGDRTELNELKPLNDMEDNQSVVEVEATLKEVTQKFHETKTEAEYATHLLEELKQRLVYDGKQDTQICLKEPPIPMTRASSKYGKKGHKKKDDEKPKSKHSEQLQKNFASASDVLKMLMNAEESIAERECLLSTLKCLCDYVRDLFEGKTEAETSPSWDEIWSSIKKESLANQGLSHAKEILSYQMESKREADYASNLLKQLNDFATNDGRENRQMVLKQPIIQTAHDSRKDGKKDSKKQTDQPPRSRHFEQLQGNYASASNVLLKQIDAENAIKERECLLLALDHLYKHSRDLSDGTAEEDISSTLDQIKSSINKESSASQGLSHARAILNIQREWKREVEYVACLLKELANVSQSTNNGDNSISLSHPENIGTLRDYETKDAKNTEASRTNPMQSVQKQKLAKHYANAGHVLKQMKEKENFRIDLGKKTAQVEELRIRLQKIQDENNEIKKEADLLRTRLSEHAGALLTYNNPSISDLSDPNRPTKLAEMYSELYDNQWSDAFANIEKKDPDISDNKIVVFLYDMLVDGYHFCEDVRQTQKSSLEDILFYPAGGMNTSQRRQKEEISTIFANHLSDVAKLSSNVSSAHMAKAFVMDEKIKDKYRKMIKLCETYIQKCVQLCWLMQVQTPPLCLDLKTNQGQTFDKNCYKEYTKKGKKIEFVVWPALFLHENGPLLSKGVAQCE